ncbi:MAG: O-antigen ligase family protein [Nitrospinaceae bacterium]|nr:O-antigen ligase family protein [Nitrospinaceae bacterium]MBT6717531.1 O-antigen ligase family protein [Nitrospina sp.]
MKEYFTQINAREQRNILLGLLFFLLALQIFFLQIHEGKYTLIFLFIPPLLCFGIGLYRPVWGVSLGMGILPLLTNEISVGAGRSISSTKITIVVLILLWFIKAEKKLEGQREILAAWLAYFVVSIISLIASGSSLTKLLAIGEVGAVFLVFLSTLSFIKNDHSRELSLVVIGAGGAVAIVLWFLQVGLLEWAGVYMPLAYRSGIEEGPSFFRGSFLAHQNLFGAYCILLGGIYFSLSTKANKNWKIILVIAGILSWVLLLKLGSVGSMVGVIVSIYVGILICGNKSKIIASTAAILLVLAFFGVKSLVSGNPDSKNGIEGSFTIRTYALKYGFKAWRDNPLLGSGPGSFEAEILRAENKSKERKPDFRFKGSLSAHNEYFRNLVERGVIGFVVFSLLISVYLWKVYTVYNPINTSMPWMFLGLLAFAVSGFFEDIYSQSGLYSIFWGLGGMYLGVVNAKDGSF